MTNRPIDELTPASGPAWLADDAELRAEGGERRPVGGDRRPGQREQGALLCGLLQIEEALDPSSREDSPFAEPKGQDVIAGGPGPRIWIVGVVVWGGVIRIGVRVPG